MFMSNFNLTLYETKQQNFVPVQTESIFKWLNYQMTKLMWLVLHICLFLFHLSLLDPRHEESLWYYCGKRSNLLLEIKASFSTLFFYFIGEIFFENWQGIFFVGYFLFIYVVKPEFMLPIVQGCFHSLQSISFLLVVQGGRLYLTLYHTILTYNDPERDGFWKYCGKRRKCW